jgi:hypothetical protein
VTTTGCQFLSHQNASKKPREIGTQTAKRWDVHRFSMDVPQISMEFPEIFSHGLLHWRQAALDHSVVPLTKVPGVLIDTLQKTNIAMDYGP